MSERCTAWMAIALGFCLIVFSLSAPNLCLAAGNTYYIGEGDVLDVTIFAGGQSQEKLEIAVASDGTIRFPFLGEIKAAGLTVSQLVALVTNPLARDYFVNPQVIVKVKEYKSQNVYITGAVTNPGLYPLERDLTLLELIAQAGGVTEERGNFAFVVKGSIDAAQNGGQIGVLIESRASTKVDLRQLLQGDAGANIRVIAGDVVYIQPSSFSNAAQYKIYVMGYVESPGVFDFQDGLSAMDACAMAGGFKKYAAPNRSVITRRSDGVERKIGINLEDVNDGKSQDVTLEPGDRIFVPRSWF